MIYEENEYDEDEYDRLYDTLLEEIDMIDTPLFLLNTPESGRPIPRSRLYAKKTKHIPIEEKEKRKATKEFHYSKRDKIRTCAKSWEHLASDLERDVENYVQSEEWKYELGFPLEEDIDDYSIVDSKIDAILEDNLIDDMSIVNEILATED